jgi:uncharacterized delta-60 repeat protein/uncharacterized repeat protein (TIGR01451 family)
VTTDFAGDLDHALDVAVQEDGKIVAAGYARRFATSYDFALARYNADGSLDTTFGGDLPFPAPGDGKVTTDFAGGLDIAHGVAIQGDGKIVAAGWAFAPVSGTQDFSDDFGLARYNIDGSLDPTFGVVGKVTTDFGGDLDYASDVAIQEDGKIVAAGVARVPGNDFALARYNTDGSLDPTFDGDGKVTTGFAGFDSAYGMAIQADGRIVAAGLTLAGRFSADFALARYNTDGSLDPTFNGDGKVTTDFAGRDDEADAVAIQGDDGKIVAAGTSSVDFAFGDLTSGDFAMARYRADFEADLSITKTGPPGRVPTGRNMTYTLTVTNNGPDSASAVTVTDQLPSSVTFVSTTATQGSCGESTGTVSCTLGEMSSGAIVTIEIVVRPTTAGRITNFASVASPTPDANQGNNTDSVDASICRITSRRSSIPCG